AVRPISYTTKAEHGEPRPGQDDKTDGDLRSGGGEVALADDRRGTLVAAVPAVEVGGHPHVGGDAGTVRSDCHCDQVGGRARPRQGYDAVLSDAGRDSRRGARQVRAGTRGLGGAKASPRLSYVHVAISF